MSGFVQEDPDIRNFNVKSLEFPIKCYMAFLSAPFETRAFDFFSVFDKAFGLDFFPE